jgi:diguanylate cyclase (GGDEF)-like protein
LNNVALRLLYELLIPAILLVAPYFAIPHLSQLSPAVQELIYYSPYAIVLFGMVLGSKFNRSRIFYFLPILGIALWSYGYFLQGGVQGLPHKVVLYALYFLLPLNVVVFYFLKERGIYTFQGGLRLAWVVAQPLAVAWVIDAKETGWLEQVSQTLVSSSLLAELPIPQPLLLLLLLGFILILAATLIRRSPIEVGFFGAFIGIAIACLFISDADLFRLYIAAVALILAISVIQDSHRMAYRDELTGLMARRALNEYMMGLGKRYTIAMLDVDHFKKFNDTYGHDVGDQVLKMVGSRMREVTGGGRPFRYGGEEFSVIFPRKSVEKTIPHLEALRESIAAYEMQLRGKERPKKPKDGKRLRSKKQSNNRVSVTISIGVAERAGEINSPEKVLKEADQALYRAKKKGRNCLSK